MCFKSWIVVTVAALCSACSVIKDSKDMKKTLGELNQKGDQLAKRISDVEQEATFDRSYKSFIEETERLFGENGKDGSNPESTLSCDPDMVVYAQAAMQSLLFQFWKGDYSDTIPTLDNRYALSVDTFFARVNKHIPRTYDVNVMAPNRSYKGIAALGALLHSVRPEYVDGLNKANLPSLSFYEVTVMALQNRNINGPQPLLPKTMNKVLEWKQEAVYVLQLRHNFLPLMVFARLTDLQDRKDMNFLGLRLPLDKMMLALKGTKVSLNNADPQFRIEDAQLRLWTYWLNSAMETRRVLREMGFTPKYNVTFGTLLNALDFGQDELSKQPTSALTSDRLKLEYSFAQAYLKTVADMGSRLSDRRVP